MKKIFTILVLSFWIISLTNAENITVNSWKVEATVKVSSTWATTSTWWTSSTWTHETDTIKTASWSADQTPIENAVYTYYYGQTCAHCQEVAKYFESVWWTEKINMDKREVWNNRDNAQKMAEDLKKLWLENDTNIWVPFLVINQWWKLSYLSGSSQIISHFESILWKYDSKKITENENIKSEKKAEEKSSRKQIFFFIMILCAIIIPAAIIIPKKK